MGYLFFWGYDVSLLGMFPDVSVERNVQRPLHYLETSGTEHPVTRRQIVGERTRRVKCYNYVKCYNSYV